MYSAVLLAHSWIRWLVLATGFIAVLGGVIGVSRQGQWTPADDRAGFWFTTALDLQMLLGLILYFFLSPITSAAMADFGAVMPNAPMRFWAVEHPFGVIAGVVLAHIGRARQRRLPADRRHKSTAIFFGLALLVILASIPWPGTPNARPLLRW
jgi:hypothetical protein